MGDMTERFLQIPSLRRLSPLRSFNRDALTVEVVFSTGAEVRRYDWWDDEYFIEVLDMSPDAVDLTRLNAGAPVLNSHRRRELEDQIGVIERAWLDGGEGIASVRFSKRESVKPWVLDVGDGVIRNVSVGYEILEMREDGFDPSNGYKRMLATRWQPFEISFVPVGADPEAQARSEPKDEHRTRCRIFVSPPPQGASERSITMADQASQNAPAGAAADISVVDNDTGMKLERARVSALQRMGTEYKLDPSVVQRWIELGTSCNDAGNEVVKIMAERSKPENSASRLDLSKKEIAGYSMTRAINAIINKTWKGAELEFEASRAIIDKLGKNPNEHTFFVPLEIQQRDLIVGTSTMGGFLVSTGNLGFIELLRNRSVLMNMGATKLSGLRGSVAVPKQTSPGTGYWLATEATAATESQLVIGQMTLVPKNIGAYTEVSRQLLLQGSPDADGLVMSDLAAVVGLAVDLAGLSGPGTGGQPTGITATSGIGGVTITTGTITYANVLEFQTDLAVANALTGQAGYVTTPAISALLKQKARFSNTDTPIWQGNVLDGNIEGIRAMTSNQVTAGQLLIGDFSKVVVAEWGTLEVEANPYANFAAGIIGIRAFYTCDIGVRYPAAFSLGTGITA